MRTEDLLSLQSFDEQLRSKLDEFNKKNLVKSTVVEFWNDCGIKTHGYVLYSSCVADCIKVLIQPIPDGPTTWIPISNITMQ